MTLPTLNLTEKRGFRLSTWLLTSLEEMSLQTVEVTSGPAELTVAGIEPDLLFAKEAWPHTDPNWEGAVFYTMTVEGAEYQFSTLSAPAGRACPAGEIFKVFPMELHWLRPDPVISTGWIALQWVVPVAETEAFELALASAIRTWNKSEFKLPQLG